MASLTIRPARVSDARDITRLHIASWRTTYRGTMPDALLDNLDLDERADARARYLEDAPAHHRRNIVCEDEGRLCGWASWGPTRDEDLDDTTVELYAIYLVPEDVGRGFGRALTAQVLRDAASSGAASMTLWVLDNNTRSIHFYEAAGFTRDARVPAEPFVMHSGETTDANKLRMVRALAHNE